MSPAESLLAFLILAVLTTFTFSIKCWDCNSIINKGCDDPFKPDDFAMADCSQKHLPRFPDKEGNICRKTIQKINDEYRVIRGCGYINDTFDTILPGAELEESCFRRTGTFSVMVEFCACNSGDGCNHSNRVPKRSVAFCTFHDSTFALDSVSNSTKELWPVPGATQSRCPPHTTNQ